VFCGQVFYFNNKKRRRRIIVISEIYQSEVS
jgi:hypothetical protein